MANGNRVNALQGSQCLDGFADDVNDLASGHDFELNEKGKKIDHGAVTFALLRTAKIDRLARSTSDLYRIISMLTEKGVAFKVTDDPAIDTTSRTGKLVMGILALIAG